MWENLGTKKKELYLNNLKFKKKLSNQKEILIFEDEASNK